jgi:hypothetical protein
MPNVVMLSVVARQMAFLVPKMFYSLYLVQNCKIAINSTAEATGKKAQILIN